MSPRRITCPICGRGDRDRTLTVFDPGRVHCHRCGKDAWRDIKAALGCEFDEHPPHRPVKPTAARNDGLAPWAAALWESSRALSGEGLAYLQARACVIPPSDGDLRWHPEVLHKPTGHTGPALIALVTDAITNKPISVHRTWIRRDGTKPVKPARMLAAGHRAKGGVIRLWSDDAVTSGIAITEGIETALAVAHVHRPVWSCIDAGNVAAFPVLNGIEAITIFADADEAGLRAAEQCAERWHAAGREVFICEPPVGDWNDRAQEAVA